MGHAIYIGDHDPVIGVYEHFHEPFVYFPGMESAKKHEVAEDHEAFDMVAVGFVLELFDYAIDRWNAGGATIEGGRNGTGVV